jgi:hypothetical protein
MGGCALAGGAITLWQAKSDTSSALKLSHKESWASVDIEWATGAATIFWPTTVPIENDADHLLGPKGVLIARKMTLHLVPGDLPSDTHRAA